MIELYEMNKPKPAIADLSFTHSPEVIKVETQDKLDLLSSSISFHNQPTNPLALLKQHDANKPKFTPITGDAEIDKINKNSQEELNLEQWYVDNPDKWEIWSIFVNSREYEEQYKTYKEQLLVWQKDRADIERKLEEKW